MSKKNKHVVPDREGNWTVRSEGSERASRVFSKKEDAVNYAKHTARKEATEVYVHRKDGAIAEKSSYKSDRKSIKA